jgi:cation:H+ antiporter
MSPPVALVVDALFGADAVLPWLAVAAAALAVLVRAAQVAVARVVAVARRYGTSDAVVASTLVAVGTSLPELGSHLVASLGILSGTLDYRVASATVLGGNMGSSTVQQTLLVGVYLLGAGRTTLSRTFLRTTYYPMLAALSATLLLSWDGTVSRLDGFVLLAGFVGYAYLNVTSPPDGEQTLDGASDRVGRDVAVAVLALGAVFASAYVVLEVVQRVVGVLGLNGSMVGVLTIGLAAALPELSTVVAAIRRHAGTIAFGTLVGSNVVNPLVGFGLGGLVSTYAVPPSVVRFDLPFKLLVGVGLLAALARGDGVLTRREGAWLVGLYFVFVSVRFLLYAT